MSSGERSVASGWLLFVDGLELDAVVARVGLAVVVLVLEDLAGDVVREGGAAHGVKAAGPVQVLALETLRIVDHGRGPLKWS